MCAALPARPASTDPATLRAEWRATIRRRHPAERLAWLENPHVVIALGAATVGNLRASLVRRLARIRVRVGQLTWVDPTGRLTRRCQCERCRSRSRFPRYYVQSVVRRGDRKEIREISYECYLERQPLTDEGVSPIPGSIGSVVDLRTRHRAA